MSYNLNIRADGKAAVMVTRIPAWHKLGQVIMKDGVDKWEAVSEALLDWEVDKVQMRHPITNEPINAWGIIRRDTGALLSGGAREKEKAMVEIIKVMNDGSEVIEMQEIPAINELSGQLSDLLESVIANGVRTN